MKFVEKVIFNRRSIDGMWNRYRVYLTLTEWDISETELYALLKGALGKPRANTGNYNEWLIYIYAEDELDAAIKVNRMFQQIPGLEETQDAE